MHGVLPPAALPIGTRRRPAMFPVHGAGRRAVPRRAGAVIARAGMFRAAAPLGIGPDGTGHAQRDNRRRTGGRRNALRHRAPLGWNDDAANERKTAN
jgi:hypothetical protein